jgi:hypothetical protein
MSTSTIKEATLDFISSACNRVNQAADWSNDGGVAFAAQNTVALYRPEVSFHHWISNVSQTSQRKGEQQLKTCQLGATNLRSLGNSNAACLNVNKKTLYFHHDRTHYVVV